MAQLPPTFDNACSVSNAERRHAGDVVYATNGYVDLLRRIC